MAHAEGVLSRMSAKGQQQSLNSLTPDRQLAAINRPQRSVYLDSENAALCQVTLTAANSVGQESDKISFRSQVSMPFRTSAT